MSNLKTFYIIALVATSYFTGAGQVTFNTKSNTIAQRHKQLDTIIRKENILGLMVSIVKNDSMLYVPIWMM